jgi:arylformamidase
MPFENLPHQPHGGPAAYAYGDECVARSRKAASQTRSLLDIAYGAHPEQTLDIYLPADGKVRNAPVLIFFHGGGWTHGFKEWNGFMAPALVDLPAILVSVSYRLLPTVAYPEPVFDALAALAWVHGNIVSHGGSPDKIAVGGHSAGGQIASLLALRHDWIAKYGLPADVVKQCFCLSATFNRRMVNANAAPDHVPPEPFTEIAPESPLALADQARIPFHIAWGGKEDERLERTGVQMLAALRQQGCANEYLFLPQDDHFSIHLNTGERSNPWTRAVRSWLAAL